ncbi:MAG: HDOD domain-containing protein [Halomonas sp.]|uniref:EAL and HDOD domain-containing protein n=1 Tax=Halomonas sp. TaxID=1486246 RepID=UPI0019DA5EEB|nr:HDOD domain-containing protein [Halomonas sp.]MBE0489540.1 HDOD domain-containing protein [Halomonas sp.]
MTHQPDSHAFGVALQPIHDAEGHHVADRLLYRHQVEAGDVPEVAVARALATAIYELDERSRLGQRDLVVDLPEEWLERPDLLPSPASQIIIGVPRRLEINDTVLERLAQVRERGYRLLIHGSSLRGNIPTLAPLANLVRLSHPDELDEDVLRALRLRGSRLFADSISDAEGLERYQQLHCHYFDGRYLAEPAFYASRPRGRHGNRAAQLRLVNELYREDVELQRLYELILQMPHLHVAVLRRANSVHFSHASGQAADLRRAIPLLGLNELRRLVMTLSLAGDLPSSKLRIRMALIRAYMCCNLAAPFQSIDPEEAFTAGLFSLMGPLLEESQEELLDELPMNESLSAALKSREGHLGALLTLAEEQEGLEAEPDERVSGDQLKRCYLEAMEQADALMSHL